VEECRATLAFTYQGNGSRNVEELVGTFGPDTLMLPCDVTRDEEIASVFDTVEKKFEIEPVAALSGVCTQGSAGRNVNTSRHRSR
jgi:enoyl-[acyl-carrier protein] reductase I